MGVLKNIFPSGDYKFFGYFKDRYNASMFNLSAVATFKSSNRDTFG